ncbi:MAG: carboxypeptidase-like regulatory domain-containing protein, partial [Acidobacteriota bacterium]
MTPTIAGRVFGSAPVAGMGTPHQARTGADGRFSLPDLPAAGWFRLQIEAGGFSGFVLDGLQIPTTPERANLGRFRLQRSLALHGWAGDEDGLPLAGVEVWMIPASVRDWDDLYA